MAEPDILLVCPFCGKPARLIDPETGYHDVEEWIAICSGCGAKRGGDYKEDAIGAWNQRAGAPERGATDGKAVGCSAWLDALMRKVAIQEAAIEICEQHGSHLWGEVYLSQIVVVGEMRPGDSVACVRCGKRVARSVAAREGQWAN